MVGLYPQQLVTDTEGAVMMAGISLWKLLIVLAIVILLFGTKRLRGMGGDLGASMRAFRREYGQSPDSQDPKPDQ